MDQRICAAFAVANLDLRSALPRAGLLAFARRIRSTWHGMLWSHQEANCGCPGLPITYPPQLVQSVSAVLIASEPSNIFQHFPVSVQVLQMGVTWINMGQHSFIDTSCCITPYSISWNWAPKVQHRTGIRSVEDLERNGYKPHFYFVEPSSAASAPSIPQAEPPAQGHPIPIPTGLSSPDKEAHCEVQEII